MVGCHELRSIQIWICISISFSKHYIYYYCTVVVDCFLKIKYSMDRGGRILVQNKVPIGCPTSVIDAITIVRLRVLECLRHRGVPIYGGTHLPWNLDPRIYIYVIRHYIYYIGCKTGGE